LVGQSGWQLSRSKIVIGVDNNALMKPKKRIRKDGDEQDTSQPGDLEEMTRNELTGSKSENSLNVSATDEEEDEGLGDGNIGRSNDDLLADD
jgi:hypothetical protein